MVIKECAESEECMDIINDPGHVLDGVRLIWSLLKHPSNVIKRNACFALVPCIKHAKDSPQMVRAFVGGLELTVSLLESEDNQVLSAVCATIAEIAIDPENLGILTDHGVVKKLADLVNTVIKKRIVTYKQKIKIVISVYLSNYSIFTFAGGRRSSGEFNFGNCLLLRMGTK